ncbi:Hypothetical acetyltransferase%2C GNAT family [Mycobacteroides abscessus]|nr:Hypothetical acetyltransferase%2C GNAT family [Mycobacteroides abscessus]
MFCDIDTAARIERAEADTIAAGTARCDDGLVIPLAGGVASYAGPDSPMNKIAGLGFGGVPSESDLADIEREFAARDTPVQAEVASLADPTICELLTARGYLLVSFEDVVARVAIGLSRAAAEFPDVRMEFSTFNSTPALLIYTEGRLDVVLAVSIADGKVEHIFAIRNPDKLATAEITRHISR